MRYVYKSLKCQECGYDHLIDVVNYHHTEMYCDMCEHVLDIDDATEVTDDVLDDMAIIGD
jgi:hypothetical protein